MAGTGVPHILLYILCWTRTSKWYLRPVLSKSSHFCCVWAKVGGSKWIFLWNKVPSKSSILAQEQKFNEDWCKDGHATRRKSQKKLPLKTFFSQKSTIFQLLKPLPESPHQTGFWPERINWDINFVLKCLPVQCDEKTLVDIDSSTLKIVAVLCFGNSTIVYFG